MDEVYVTYVDDEHVGNHDYDESTDDDHGIINYIYIYMVICRLIYGWSIGDLSMMYPCCVDDLSIIKPSYSHAVAML